MKTRCSSTPRIEDTIQYKLGFVPARVLLTSIQYRLLKTIAPFRPDHSSEPQAPTARLEHIFGPEAMQQLSGRTVIDFGCGEGREAVEFARRGAAHVYGVEIRPELHQAGRENALRAGVADRCEFVVTPPRPADLIFSIDAFEHFDDPAAILSIMETMLAPGGAVHISFGPPWYHPRGGHLFSIFPWAHLIFSEAALIRWRADFKSDGATRFSEVAGGLNQMTIRRFERLVAASPFRFASMQIVPIRPLRALHTRLTREFTTSVVRCRLLRK